MAAALVFGEHHLKGPLLRAAAARTGRQIPIDGTVEAHLFSLHPRLTATEVSVGNPSWMPAGVTAKAARVSLVLEWLTAGRVLGIRRLEVERADLHLARDAAGRANWRLHEEGPATGPPLIRSLSIPDAKVQLRDDLRHLEFNGKVSAGDADAGGGPPPLRMQGAGELNGRPATFVIEGDPLEDVRRDRPYHFNLHEHSGPVQLTAHAVIEHPFDIRWLEATFNATGPDLKDLYYVVGIRLADTGPFRLSGRVARDGLHFEYTDLTVASGQSDVSGTLSVDGSGARTSMQADLSSQLLRLSDIGATAAGRAAKESEARALPLPETLLPLPMLRRADAAVKFHARTLEVGPATLHSVNAVVTLEGGLLSFEKFRATLEDGTISGNARLDASRDLPRGELNLNAANLPLDQWRGASTPPVSGALNARVQLRGAGKSAHELAATASGTISAVLPHGALRDSIAEAASLDLTGTLGALSKNHPQAEIHCAVAGFDVREGLATAHTLVLDTDRALITGSGTVGLDSEALDLVLRGRPKHAGLALRSAIAIKGTLRHPEPRLVGHEALAQAGAAVALALVLTPVAAVLAFVDPGLTRDADCGSLIAQAGTAATLQPASPHP